MNETLQGRTHGRTDQFCIREKSSCVHTRSGRETKPAHSGDWPSLCENAKIWKGARMIFLKSTKTGQACESLRP